MVAQVRTHMGRSKNRARITTTDLDDQSDRGSAFCHNPFFESSPRNGHTVAGTSSLLAAAQSSRSSKRIDESKTTPGERQTEPE